MLLARMTLQLGFSSAMAGYLRVASGKSEDKRYKLAITAARNGQVKIGRRVKPDTSSNSCFKIIRPLTYHLCFSRSAAIPFFSCPTMRYRTNQLSGDPNVIACLRNSASCRKSPSQYLFTPTNASRQCQTSSSICWTMTGTGRKPQRQPSGARRVCYHIGGAQWDGC